MPQREMSAGADRATEAEGDTSMIGQQDVTSTGKDVWLVGGIPAFGNTLAGGVAVYFYRNAKAGKTWWVCEEHGSFNHRTRKEGPHVDAVKQQRKENRDIEAI